MRRKPTVFNVCVRLGPGRFSAYVCSRAEAGDVKRFKLSFGLAAARDLSWRLRSWTSTLQIVAACVVHLDTQPYTETRISRHAEPDPALSLKPTITYLPTSLRTHTRKA